MNPHGHGFLPFTGGWWLSLAIFCVILSAGVFAVGFWQDWRRERRLRRQWKDSR